MLIEEQIAERRLRARKEAFKIEPQGRGVFGDYQVFSPTSKRSYRVAFRGVGLFDNYCLQAASAVINVEPPWNPARLEQRIARVHRMGQVRAVLAIHLLTENSIEERVWETIRLKKELFKDLSDGAGTEVSFEKLGRRSMIETLKEILPDSEASESATEMQKPDGPSNGRAGREVSTPASSNGANGAGHAAGSRFKIS